jgi:hypothetical protein
MICHEISTKPPGYLGAKVRAALGAGQGRTAAVEEASQLLMEKLLRSGIKIALSTSRTFKAAMIKRDSFWVSG